MKNNLMKNLAKKFIKIGTCCLVFLLLLQTRLIIKQGMINGNPNEFLTASLYGVDAFIILLAVLRLFSNFKFKIKNFKLISNFKFQISNLALFAGLFISWNILSVFWAQNKTLAVQHTAWILLAAGLIWLIRTFEYRQKLIHTFLVGLTLSAWLGIWQFVFQKTFASKWLGLALHDPQLGGTSIVEIYAANGSPIRWLRAYSFFDHPNIFGIVMVVGILLTVAEIIRKYDRNKIEIWLKYLALVSMSAGLFMSLSRSAWLGLALGFSALIIFFLWEKYFEDREMSFLKFFKSTPTLLFQRRVLVFSVALVASMFIILATIYPNQFLMRSGGMGRLEEKSLDDRGVFLQQGKDMIKNNFWLGVGAGNYIASEEKNNSGNPAWTYQPVHNVFLLVWAELGIIGMLITLVLLFSVVRNVWQSKNILGLVLLLSLLPTLLLDHWLWSLHFGVLFFGLITGIALKNTKTIRVSS